MFVLDIEQGVEVFINSDLSIDNFPLSFHYYDPVMLIIQQRMSDDRKEYFIKKNKILKDFEQASVRQQMKNILKDRSDKLDALS